MSNQGKKFPFNLIPMENIKNVSRTHKGVNYSAPTQEDIDRMIKNREFEQSIFHRSSVYTYSRYARDLEDGRVEKVEYFKNGESSKTSYYENRDEFWKSI